MKLDFQAPSGHSVTPLDPQYMRLAALPGCCGFHRLAFRGGSDQGGFMRGQDVTVSDPRPGFRRAPVAVLASLLLGLVLTALPATPWGGSPIAQASVVTAGDVIFVQTKPGNNPYL